MYSPLLILHEVNTLKTFSNQGSPPGKRDVTIDSPYRIFSSMEAPAVLATVRTTFIPPASNQYSWDISPYKNARPIIEEKLADAYHATQPIEPQPRRLPIRYGGNRDLVLDVGR